MNPENNSQMGNTDSSVTHATATNIYPLTCPGLTPCSSCA